MTALLLDVAESALRRFTRDTLLVLLLVATMTTPACLVADDLPPRLAGANARPCSPEAPCAVRSPLHVLLYGRCYYPADQS